MALRLPLLLFIFYIFSFHRSKGWSVSARKNALLLPAALARKQKRLKTTGDRRKKDKVDDERNGQRREARFMAKPQSQLVPPLVSLRTERQFVLPEINGGGQLLLLLLMLLFVSLCDAIHASCAAEAQGVFFLFSLFLFFSRQRFGSVRCIVAMCHV